MTDYAAILAQVGAGRTLVRYDTRGCGASQRDVDDVSAGALAADIDAVVRAIGFDRVSLLGSAMTGLIAIRYAAEHPERVAALVLFGAIARTTATGSPDVLRGFAQLARSNWEVCARTLASVNLRRAPEDAARHASVYFRSVSGEMAARMMEQNIDNDERDSLARIAARTLVIHSTADAMYPFSSAQEIAAGIPGARLFALQGNHSLTALGDKINIVGEKVNSFLDEDPETRRTVVAGRGRASGLQTILFTDLVGHTAMMRRLGDEKGREVLREHERITRAILKTHGGAEVKTMGDGFMASFGSVTSAVECALALQQAFAERNETSNEPLEIRVGLNAGEPIEDEGDLFGETVILAARIAAMAQGGEILASLAVRELCAGKGFLFADLGEHAMRGFEDPVRVFEIKRRD
jgi:class 3 adenylate cyclase